jgi:hypothetical protein
MSLHRQSMPDALTSGSVERWSVSSIIASVPVSLLYHVSPSVMTCHSLSYTYFFLSFAFLNT